MRFRHRVSLCIALGSLCLLTSFCGCPALAQTPTSSASASPSGSSVPAPAIKANLQRILEHREYQPETKEKNPIAEKLEEARKLWERFRKWLGRLFQTGALQGGSSLVIYTLLTFIGAGMIWIVVRMFRDRASRPSLASPHRQISGEEEALPDIVRDPEFWLVQAEQLAAAQDYRRAFRAVFLALLLRLDEANALSYDRARTNGDYLLQLRTAGHATLHAWLLPFAHAFDAHWYGVLPTTPEDYQSILQASSRLTSLLPSASSSSAVPAGNAAAPASEGGHLA